MPSPALTEAGKLRLSSLGFFLALFFALARLFQLLWNWLRVDFPSLPLLGYKRALAVVFTWGMALELVLTMISGARELMTPGAWEKVGVTYQTRADRAGALASDRSMAARRYRVERLAAALKGLPRLPVGTRSSTLPDDFWIAPGGSRYVYFGALAEINGVLVCEPPGIADERLVILRDFTIISAPEADVTRRLSGSPRSPAP